jgi:arylsulfatase A-like enzyme
MKKKTRRQFLAGTTATASLAVGPQLTGCGSKTPTRAPGETASPVARRVTDDPLSPVQLPMPQTVFRPPNPGRATRSNWEPKNVIVIMLDSFRADHLGAFGHAKVKTPNLDRFAADSTLFTHSYPEGLPTVPVRTSLFTGKFTYPFRGWQVLYPEDQPLLTEILWSEGFESCLVADTYHLHKPSYGFGRGFDQVVWIRGQEGDPYVRDPRIKVDLDNYFKPRTGQPGEMEQTRQYLLNRHDWKTEDDHFTPRVIGHAIDWLKTRRRRENLFLWVDSFCPHEPWDPPDRYLKMVAPDYKGQRLVLPTPGDVEGYLSDHELKNVMSLYAGMVAFVDACVGHFLDEVKRLGLYDNSLIVILTDHGEPFGDHGIVRKVRPWPYEELAHTFLMIRHPGGPAGRRVNSYTQQTDITPTILEYLSIKPLPEMTATSLMPLLLGKESKVHDFAVCCHHMGGLSIRRDEWSYHYYLPGNARSAKGSNLTKNEPELFNLREDPTEQKNLAKAEPDRAKDMHRTLVAFTDELIEREGAAT